LLRTCFDKCILSGAEGLRVIGKPCWAYSLSLMLSLSKHENAVFQRSANGRVALCGLDARPTISVIGK